jgi:nicotinamide phosphoribosyltransferase
MEQAGLGGMSVLLNTISSDSMMAVPYAVNYYNADVTNLLKSVRATEHAVSTPYGEGVGELSYVRNILKKHPNGIKSFVADTNGIVQFVMDKLPILKEDIIAHWKNGKGLVNKTVIRPDSKRFEGDTPAKQCLWLVEELGEIFGFTQNDKGYNVLHPCIGAIYGDSLTQNDITEVYQTLIDNGWSAENMLVGMGGGLLQRDFHRDVLATAFKASCQKFFGVWRDVKKKTTEAFKRSLSGKFSTVKRNGILVTVPQLDEDSPERDYLEPVYKDGVLLRDQSFEEIKKIVWDI